MRQIDIFHIGPQKAATTWVYRCLKEHPQICCPPKDSVHYYDIHYERGSHWYENHFSHAEPSQLLFDPTPSYIRSPIAIRRMASDNPKAKIVICIRHPVERAFSHYWHEKKKKRINYAFDEVLQNYDLFSSWVEPGLYAEHLKRIMQYFPQEQILCQLFDDLGRDPQAFLEQLTSFLGIERSFSPAVLKKRVNVAGYRRTLLGTCLGVANRVLERFGVGVDRVPTLLTGKSEYQRGISPELHDSILRICKSDIEELERILSIDLSRWKLPRGVIPEDDLSS